MTPMSGHSEALRTTAAASWRMATKRLEDIVVAAIGIVILAPVFAVIAIAIRLEDGGAGILSPSSGRPGRETI